MDEVQPAKNPLIFLPLGLVILALIVVQVIARAEPTRAETAADMTATPMTDIDAPAETAAVMAVPTFAQATPFSVLTPASSLPEPDVQAAVPVVAEALVGEINLQGPPVGVRLAVDRPLVFYWHSQADLAKGDYFSLFLARDGLSQLVGEIDEANLGRGYHASIRPGDVLVEPGDYEWFVTLTNGRSGQVTARSENRAISLLGNADETS